MLYKVLKPGIRQRSSEGGFVAPKVGDIIIVSDAAAGRLILRGFIEAASSPEPAKKKKKDKDAGWPSEAKPESTEGEKE